jgi:hypothetical protein
MSWFVERVENHDLYRIIFTERGFSGDVPVMSYVVEPTYFVFTVAIPGTRAFWIYVIFRVPRVVLRPFRATLVGTRFYVVPTRYVVCCILNLPRRVHPRRVHVHLHLPVSDVDSTNTDVSIGTPASAINSVSSRSRPYIYRYAYRGAPAEEID